MIVTTPVAGAASPVRLPGFEYRSIDVEGVIINCAVRGSGPPLLFTDDFDQKGVAYSQTIYITEGIGRCQRRGGSIEVSASATGRFSSPARTTGTAPLPTAS
jgi:hypothetical protein